MDLPDYQVSLHDFEKKTTQELNNLAAPSSGISIRFDSFETTIRLITSGIEFLKFHVYFNSTFV